MRLRSWALLGLVASGLLLLCGAALAAKTYPDRVRDVAQGPNILSVTVSDTKANVTFRLRFAQSPPLGLSRREGWVDMLLLGIDVPPLGPRPVAGGEWRGADYYAGFHGRDTTGVLVGVPQSPAGTRDVLARFRIVVRGSTATFSIPRAAIGNPGWFDFAVAAAREWGDEAQEPSGATPDVAPARGAFRYRLTA